MSAVKFGQLSPGYGEMELITGCMFTGKSTEALRRADHYRRCADTTVLVVKSVVCTRDDDSVVATHTGQTAPCQLRVRTGPELVTAVKQHGNVARLVVVIDEAQFIEELDIFVKWALDHPDLPAVTLHVILAALDTKWSREEWPEIQRVQHLASRVDKLTGICMCCQAAPSIWSRREWAGEDTKSIVIGAESKYSAVCGPCYHHTGRCVHKRPPAAQAAPERSLPRSRSTFWGPFLLGAALGLVLARRPH